MKARRRPRARPWWLLLLVLAAGASAQQPLARSVLYVVVDDLTADLSVFGGRIDQTSTPNLERLARRSTLFTRAYAQQAVCGPSRNSFLTGRYPDTLRVYTFMRSFRDDLPDAVSLPQAFKQQGYLTCGFGKIFHDDGTNSPPDYDQPYSWSEECPYYAPPEDFCALNDHGWCTPDLPEANFTDARGVDAAIARLRQHVEGAGAGDAGQQQQPFFFAVGLRKPHLDWYIPKEFLDRQVPQRDITLPPLAQRVTPEGMPPVAWWNGSSEGPWPYLPIMLSPIDPLPADLMQELRRAYLGAVSWADHQLGKLLDALESLELTESTAIVLHADHGFHLGDSGEWCKQTTTEVGTRVPLLVALPPSSPSAAPAAAQREDIVELVDVYPTLLEVAGVPLPDPALPGRSLVPLLLSTTEAAAAVEAAAAAGGAKIEAGDEALQALLDQLPREEAQAILSHGAAFSQFPRCSSTRREPSSLAHLGYNWNRQCMMLGNGQISAMGYAVRVHGWRYAEWYAFDPRTWMPRWNATDGLLGVELYAMDGLQQEEGKDGRTRNRAGEAPAVAGALSRLLQQHFWPLLRPREPWAADISAGVAATRWARPPPPGKGDAVGIDEEEVKEAWGDLWLGDGPGMTTAVDRRV